MTQKSAALFISGNLMDTEIRNVCILAAKYMTVVVMHVISKYGGMKPAAALILNLCTWRR